MLSTRLRFPFKRVTQRSECQTLDTSPSALLHTVIPFVPLTSSLRLVPLLRLLHLGIVSRKAVKSRAQAYKK